MSSLKNTIRQLKEKFLNMGAYKVFAIILGAILLPIILEWLGLGLIAIFVIGFNVIMRMIFIYSIKT